MSSSAGSVPLTMNATRAADLDGVVGESLIEAAEQRGVDGGGHAVLPLGIHQQADQAPVQLVQVAPFIVSPARPLISPSWAASSSSFS